MKRELDAAQRLVGDDGKAENVALASKDWKITSHDDAEHRATVLERRRLHIFRLGALQRELAVLITVAKNCDTSGRQLAVADLFPSTLLHVLGQRERELMAVIRMHESHLAALELSTR